MSSKNCISKSNSMRYTNEARNASSNENLLLDHVCFCKGATVVRTSFSFKLNAYLIIFSYFV